MATLRGILLAAFLSALIGGCSKSDEPNATESGIAALLARAESNLAANNWFTAEKDYRTVLRMAHTHAVASRRLGLLYVEQGQFPLAYPLLKQALEAHPDDPEILLKLGTIFQLSRDHKQARAAALKVLEKQPGREEALVLIADTTNPAAIEETHKLVDSLREKDQDRPGYHLAYGILALQQNDGPAAEREFKKALELNPRSVSALTALATFYWRYNSLESAGKAFKAAIEADPLHSHVLVRYVDFLFATGPSDRAIKVLEDANRDFPEYLPPRIYLMKVACEKKLDDLCSTRVQDVLRQAPTNFDALFMSGNLSMVKEDYAAAMRTYGQAVALNGQSGPILFNLARATLYSAQSGDPVDVLRAVDSAEKILTESLRLNVTFLPTRFLLAELKIRKGRSPVAVDLLLPIVQEQPQIQEAHQLLASAYLASQDRDAALAVYRRMLELFPQNPQPAYLAGLVLLGKEDARGARGSFERAILISADFAPALEGLTNLDINEGKLDDALERATAQIERNPASAEWRGLRGKIRIARQELALAEPDLVKAIELNPDLEPAFEQLARLYITTGRAKDAIEKLRGFFAKTKTAPALMFLATMHEQANEFSRARDTYEQLLATTPNYTPALNNLAVLYSERLGDLQKAYTLALRARDAIPNNAAITDTLGWVLFRRGEFAEAARLLKESAEDLPDNPAVQFHFGMALYMLGDEAQAGLFLQRAADTRSDQPFKDEARQRAEFLRLDAASSGFELEVRSFLARYPNDPLAAARLASLQQRKGEIEGALKTYEQVHKDHPAFAPVTRALALLYGQRPTDSSRAIAVANEARSVFPKDPAVAKVLGVLSYQREDLPRAVELLKESVAKMPDDAESAYYLGQSHRQLSQMRECRSMLERALQLSLPSQFVREAKASLEHCSEVTQ